MDPTMGGNAVDNNAAREDETIRATDKKDLAVSGNGEFEQRLEIRKGKCIGAIDNDQRLRRKTFVQLGRDSDIDALAPEGRDGHRLMADMGRLLARVTQDFIKGQQVRSQIPVFDRDEPVAGDEQVAKG